MMQTSSWRISYGFVDRAGNTARTSVAFPISDYSATDIQDKAAQIANRLEAISDARITDYVIGRSYEPANQFSPEPQSDVTRTGVLVVSLASEDYALLLLPSIRLDSLVQYTADGCPFCLNLYDARFNRERWGFSSLSDEYDNPFVDWVIGGISY